MESDAIEPVNMQSEESLRTSGFEGFVSTSTLAESRCSRVPDVSGVYLVLRQNAEPPRFLERSPAGQFKGEDPTVAVEDLQANWVPSAIVLYIGSTAQQLGLRRRLDELTQFGFGKSIGHWGGRYIWQLGDHGDLIVCWREDSDPPQAKRQLLAQFIDEYGTRPFANLRN